MRDVLGLVCSPGLVGTMATDAAANDPVFWPLHLLYDRSWHGRRLAGSLEDDWAYSAAACPGANPGDALPFAFGDYASLGGGNGAGTMTNEEMYAYMDPSSDALPYVYDSFA